MISTVPGYAGGTGTTIHPGTFYPTGRTTRTRRGTRTLAGVTPEAERAARTSAYADIDPRTFGMVSDEDMEAFRAAFERSMFGQAGAEVEAMLAERGMGAKGGEALRALMRSQAALPLARIDYERRARGAAAFSSMAAERARQAYLALTAGRTETYEETGEETPFTTTPPGMTAGVGIIGGLASRGATDDDWWERTKDRGPGGSSYYAVGGPAAGYTDEFLGPGGYEDIMPYQPPQEPMSPERPAPLSPEALSEWEYTQGGSGAGAFMARRPRGSTGAYGRF